MDYFLGIDVGTGSARVGLFDATGLLVAHHSHPIEIWQPRDNFVEQSSDNIWEAICHCCKLVCEKSKVDTSSIRGVGFDATCSLVLIDSKGDCVSIDLEGDDKRNVIVWMDHRALSETTRLNSLCEKYSVFDFIGGKISPEMQIPKLVWIKNNLPSSWKRTAHFLDLPDYLTYRATGNLDRSLCSLTCKWTYLSHEAKSNELGWHSDFLNAANLGELVDEDYIRIGQTVRPMGESIGGGLCDLAAKELGLKVGTKVGVSIIDAHAGGIGMLGMSQGGQCPDWNRRLALIGGTSSCHMAVASERRAIPGVWGPYYSAMVPGMWLNEGGQSATGALVDHTIFNHGASEAAQKAADAIGISLYTYLNQTLEAMSVEGSIDVLTQALHVCPYFHGNRSPRADPNLTGMISGLKLTASIEDLALLYLATVQSIAYGTQHIIESMNASGYAIDTLVCCGGGTKNPVFMQQHANATGCRLWIPKEPESVLLGSAMLGAVAAGRYNSIEQAMPAMSKPGIIIEPQKNTKSYHDAKYKVFQRLYDDQIAYQSTMSNYRGNSL